MRKNLTAISIICIAAMMTVGCKSAQQSSDNKDETTSSKVAFNFQSGSNIPDGFDDYGETKSAEELLKATGYEYDLDSLTYELVWEDNFDGDSLNLDNWTYEIGTGSWGWGNNEIQYYTDGGNDTVADGLLTIELRKETDENGREKVTSTRIKTAGKADFKYGKFEMRAKLPQGKGTWPAFWMMPTKSAYGSWPASGEIDIMEFVGYSPYYSYNTVHNKSFNGGNGMQKGSPTKVDGLSEEFHTFCLEWLPDKMIFYTDGVESFTYDPHEYADTVTSDQWPYDQEFYMILNFAWGGNWGGAQGVDESCLPQKYQIDYVRVYQSPEITALTADK